MSTMNSKDLSQIFKNRFDCYAAMDEPDGPSVMAMSEERFIEVVESILEEIKNEV